MHRQGTELEALVLRGWGCGPFKNGPRDVARLFSGHLTGKGLLSRAFKKIVFAVLDSRGWAVMRPFENVFLY
jgi:uncharacterized protein (TIGR02452 family)